MSCGVFCRSAHAPDGIRRAPVVAPFEQATEPERTTVITPKLLYDLLVARGADFFAGIPDSLLKDFCAYITDHTPRDRHVIAANEGAAVGLAAGYHIATGRYPVVYLQNSGMGTIVNPLLSLVDEEVYSVPVIFVVGWRGEPGTVDEPQHVKQGKVTLDMLQAMGMKYAVLSDNEDDARTQIDECFTHLRDRSAPYFFVVRRGTFAKYALATPDTAPYELDREEALKIIVSRLDAADIVVSTTGMLSRELFELREALGHGHDRDFLTVGSMGHSSQIALGIALHARTRTIFSLDGDGAALMHLGSLAIIGSMGPTNFKHIVFNNGAHDSVGGQSTVGFHADLCAVAKACRYRHVFSAATRAELEAAIRDLRDCGGPAFLEIRIRKGSRENLERPTSKPVHNKQLLMAALQR